MSILEPGPVGKIENDIDVHDENFSNKVLGLTWLPGKDIFKISIPDSNNKECERYTKRLVLSVISKMFDPMLC